MMNMSMSFLKMRTKHRLMGTERAPVCDDEFHINRLVNGQTLLCEMRNWRERKNHRAFHIRRDRLSFEFLQLNKARLVPDFSYGH